MSRISRSDRPRAALLRWLPLGLVLGLVGIVVPDSAYVEPPAALVRVASDDGRAVGIAHDPAVIWILAIGSDARPGQPVLRSRADAIQLVGINARTGTAAALGIPRDSYVAIPGYGRNRVNAALTFGGPQLMARTVAGMTGVRPDYVMVTSFGGFERMVDAIGGITVNSRYAFSDVVRPRGYRVGKNRLNGLQAHVFARLRKPFPRGDFDRSANQQRAMFGILREIRSKKDRRGFLERGTLAAIRNLSTDLGPVEAYRLAHAVAQVRPGRVRTCVLRGGTGMAGAASVVFPDLAQAQRFGRRAGRDARLEGGCG